jgi:hypothetical protein
MSKYKFRSLHLQWALSASLVLGGGLGLAALLATSSGCEQNKTVSENAPAEDAIMKKVTINVFGMT